jgi:hypothetical protein
MGIAQRSSRLLRQFAIAGFAAASQLSAGLAAAHAGEPDDDEALVGTIDGRDAIATRNTGMVVGFDALALMQQHRREQRGVPRMLPLLATNTERGHLWFGLARERGEAQGASSVRLEMRWLIPLGR